MKLVKVTWIDISGGDSWMDAKEALKWAEGKFTEGIASIGYLLEDNDNFVVIAATHDETQQRFHDISMIPKSVVLKVETIKQKK